MIKQLKVSVGQHSDKGPKDINQDFHGIRTPTNALLNLKGIAVAMADGISSSDVSQIASQIAVKNFLDDYYCTAETWTVKKSAERVLGAVNSWLYSQSQRGPYSYDKDKGYICTLSALIIKNHSAHIFHVGDTRIYRLNNAGMEQLTHDHRLWVDDHKSYLSRALGIDDQCAFDSQTLDIRIHDIFIIATDGVYEFANSATIIETIAQHNNNLDAAAKAIIAHALANGSDDNLSLQIVRIDELPDASSDLLQQNVQQQIEQYALAPSLAPRMEFDGYTIVRELHSNNRSHVYLAVDNGNQQQVVIKSLATENSRDPAQLEQFLMEEWIARRINNAHVLKTYNPERERHFIYTVFEYIEGQTLAQWALDNPQPSIEAVRGIIEQIAKGLHAFHRMEMLHQDLRPENIMIDSTGTVKIIDFGSVIIAGLHEAQTKQPDTYLKGTALYSAPEYFLGEAGTLQSELYSLGVITYFLICGKYPYGTHVAKTKTLAAQKNLFYQSLRDDEKEIPAWVDDAIRKAVNPQPHKRQEEIFEFINDLRQPSRSFITKTRPPLIDRNPVAVWQAISAILLIIIIYLLNTPHQNWSL